MSYQVLVHDVPMNDDELGSDSRSSATNCTELDGVKHDFAVLTSEDSF